MTDRSRSGKFSLQSDEPMALLGSDTAVSPGEYVLQALAGCYTVTLVANAAARGIELSSLDLELECDFDLNGFLGINPGVRSGAQEIRARVSGYLDSIDFKDGQMVKKGDLLFTIDKRPFQNAVDQAKGYIAGHHRST